MQSATPTKYLDYYDQLRRRIVTGDWSPGDRLPNRTDLRDELNTSLATVQKVLDRLRDDGFVRARGRAGTYVADRLPSQYRVGVAMPAIPQRGATWSRMWQALEFEAAQINHQGNHQVRFYYGLQSADSPDTQRLANDLASQTLGGVFWMGMSTAGIDRYPQLKDGSTRLIAFTGDAEQRGYPSVRMVPYLDRVLDYLQQSGRQRIGLVNSALVRSNLAAFQSGLARRGMIYDPYNCMSAYPVESDAVRVAVYHMVKNAEHRPDSLFVVDDHMVEPVTQGLRDAGCGSPDDMLVVAHCNYPLPPIAHVPVKYVGFDLAAILDRVVNYLAPLADGTSETLPMVFEAAFDHELPSARRSQQQAKPHELNAEVRDSASPNYLAMTAF